MYWVAQALAVVICIISSISYFSKKKKDYIAVQLLVNVLYGVQYYLLGAMSGTVSNVVSTAKYVVFYGNAKRGRKNPTWQVFFFCALGVVLGLFVIEGWHSWIPIVNSVMYTYAIWQDNPIILRVVVIVCNVLWVLFGIAVGAYVSAAYSAVELTVVVITMVRMMRK